MAVGVYKPAPKQDNSGQLLQLAGTALGGAFGGPGGASVGGMIGGMAAPKPNEPTSTVQTGGDAFQRRMQSLQQNPQMQIADSIDSLKYIQDPAQRAELAKPLLQADFMARNKKQV